MAHLRRLDCWRPRLPSILALECAAVHISTIFVAWFADPRLGLPYDDLQRDSCHRLPGVATRTERESLSRGAARKSRSAAPAPRRASFPVRRGNRGCEHARSRLRSRRTKTASVCSALLAFARQRWCCASTTVRIFDVVGGARISPEAERTLAFAHGLGERGQESAMVVSIALIAPGPFLQLGSGAGSFKKKPATAVSSPLHWRRQRWQHLEEYGWPWCICRAPLRLLGCCGESRRRQHDQPHRWAAAPQP
jgi:hypothetical protein